MKNLSLRVNSGEHIGIIGDSGCGKSTLLNILAGLYEPDCGKAVIAGECFPGKIREQVALVMQNNSLFPLYGLICAILFIYNGIIWSKYAALSAKTEVWLQKMLLEKILSLPLKQVNYHFSGEWITKLNSDIQVAFTMMNGPMKHGY